MVWIEHEACPAGFNTLISIKLGVYGWVPAALRNSGGFESKKQTGHTWGTFVCAEAVPRVWTPGEHEGEVFGEPDRGHVPRKIGVM